MPEIPSPSHLANSAPRWLVVIFAIGLLPPLLLAAVMLASLATSGNGNVVNFLVALATSGGAVAALSVQVSALAGLLAHRHWAREVALLAEVFWTIGATGFVVAFIGGGGQQLGLLAVAAVSLALGFPATRALLRSWDLGPPPVYENAIHPHGFVTWASAFAAALVLPFAAFAVWLVGYIQTLAPTVPVGNWVTISLLMTLMTLPWFLVHAVAAYGLYHRQDYGLALAIIGGVLWFFTVVGLPIGAAQLYSVWRVGHPALALPSRLATRGAAQA